MNENEIEANSDTLTPLLDDMMKCRKKGVEDINRIFGTNIKVDFASSWKRVHKREINAQKAEDAETKIIEKEAEASILEKAGEAPVKDEKEGANDD